MERVAFTGTRHLRDQDRALIRGVVSALPTDTMLIVGGCIGVDAEVARAGIERGCYVYLVLPANMSQVDPGWHDYFTRYEVAPPGTTYKDRDRRMVALAERVIAFPQYPESHPSSRRSGTWLTIRLARQYHRPVTIYTLSQPT